MVQQEVQLIALLQKENRKCGFILKRLVGFPGEPEGCLDKLKKYCKDLDAKIEKEDSAALIKHVKSAFNYAHNEDDANKLVAAVKKMQLPLVRLLRRFKNDEHVLLFLLHHQELWEEHVKKVPVKKVLSEFYPAGLYDAKKQLIKTFAKKGFDQVVGFVNHKFVDLNL